MQIKLQQRQFQMLESQSISFPQLPTPCTVGPCAIPNIGFHRGSMESRGHCNFDFFLLPLITIMLRGNVAAKDFVVAR